jgi:transcriptional regulator with XRE-family HTH domain
MEFKDWFYQIFSEWRGRSRRSLAGFAAHLGISQAIASNWVNDHRAGPEGYQVITAIAHEYPEIYRVLGLPLAYGEEFQQIAEAWPGLNIDDRLEILRISNAENPRQERNPNVAVFGDWIYQKFYEWRGQSRSNKYASQFAGYIGIPKATTSHWINGTRANTADYRTIVILAHRYPEIYTVMGLPLPYCDEVQQIAEAWSGLANEKRSRILAITGISSTMPAGEPSEISILQK